LVSPISRPKRSDVHVFETVKDLRAWFEASHETAPEAFIGFYRKGVDKPSVTYAQIVEEALCFGWIDGITFRVDDEVTANRYTPRRPTSNWSAINIAKVAELRAAGRMHPAGIRAFDERDRRKDAVYSYEQPEVVLPAPLMKRLRADKDAWRTWESETPSYRRGVTHWVMAAKRPETRERRFTTLIADSAAGRRIGPMLVSREQRDRGR
jgi:uncharacterized protein YdeI (YjbR/CyaY-like superfamily)